MMGIKVIEIFQGKRSDYYAAIASVSFFCIWAEIEPRKEKTSTNNFFQSNMRNKELVFQKGKVTTN
jgi:hypothetical protein